MSTVALPGISAQHSILALGPKGPRANMDDSILALGPKGPRANMELPADMPGNATVAM